MLSILIPVYNFDIFTLVSDLNIQSQNADIEYEIIVVDDKSNDFFKQKNKNIKNLKNVKYIELTKNIGRSKIRNFLANEANFENLLFMDCDSKVFDNNYIQNYIKNINNSIIYGGREYEQQVPENQDFYLRWLYGTKREVKPANERNLNPNKSFMTNNFLIKKTIFNNVKFNEQINTYGHEDTLFGFELEKNNIEILHIDNPLIHIGLETNTEFIEKTKQGVKNLKFISELLNNDKNLINNIKLLKIYHKIKLLKPFIILFYKIFKPLIFKNLKSKKPNLHIFDFYKLATMFEK